MTVQTQVKKVTANGNDSATVFSFNPIVIYASSEITVTHVDSAGTETLLSEGSSSSTYSVSVSSYPNTGSITYPAVGGTPLATGASLVIKRVLTLEQQTKLRNQGGYNPNTQEDQFDRLLMIDLQQQELIDRSVLFPISTSISDNEAPNFGALKYLRGNSAGTGLEWATISASEAAASDSTPGNISLTAGDAGTGGAFSRADHVHLLSVAANVKSLLEAANAAAMRAVLVAPIAPTSTDEALARYTGTSGDLQNSGWTLDDSDVLTSGGQLTMGHTLEVADQILSRPYFKDWAEAQNDVSSSSGTLTLDLSTGNVFEVTLDENVTTLTISNWPATGRAGSCILKVIQGASAYTIDFSGRHAPGGIEPVVSTGSGDVDFFAFYSDDAGTTQYVFNQGQDWSAIA